MRNKETKQMASSLDITTAYQTVSQPSGWGSVALKGGQVVLTFKRTSGTSLTFKVDELFSYKNTSGVEVVGFTTRKEVDSVGTGMDDIEITETDTTFSYAFTTLADEIQVQVKGGDGDEVLDLLMTVGEVQ